jgi:hypothetical protein
MARPIVPGKMEEGQKEASAGEEGGGAKQRVLYRKQGGKEPYYQKIAIL